MEDDVAEEATNTLPVPYEFTSAQIGGTRGRYGRPEDARRFDALKRETYVNLIRQGYRRHRAAEMVGISARCLHDALHADPDFREAVSEAEMAKIDEVEEAMFETAIAGHFGAQQFILTNRRAELWADTRTQRVREELLREAEEEGRDEEDAPPAIDSLRSRMLEIRDRLLEDAPEPAPAE